MADEDLLLRPVTELAALMRRGEVSPVELTGLALARVERLNPSYNAVVTVLEGPALAQARASEERIRRGEALPLDGVPIPIKDNVDIAGVPTTYASRMADGRPEETDATVVARLRQAGCVFIGKTNLPEFGTVSSTESRRFGPCRNPWDPTRTPGGSSGGAAVAVATGMAPAAHGNDGGGSLRIPAACTGLFSMKPSRGRISYAPIAGEWPMGLNVEGFITRSVADNAVLLDTVAGYEGGDPYWAPPPARPFTDEVGADPGPMRFALTVEPPIDVPVHPACLEATRSFARLLESLGHTVDEVSFPRDEATLPDFLGVWSVLIGWEVQLLVDRGADPTLAEPLNHALWQQSRSLAAIDYAMATRRQHTSARDLAPILAAYDGVVTPVLAQPPIPLGTLFEGDDEDVMGPFSRAALFTPFTASVNVAGLPAAALPAGEHEGLPLGVQVIGRPAGEAALYRLAGQVEAAAPWAARRPPLAGVGRPA